MKIRKTLAIAGALCMVLSGCKGGGTAGSKVGNLDSYPIETDAELTYWMGLNTNVSSTTSNMGNTEYAKKLYEKTGVKVKYIHPALGQEAESFSLMVASNDLADIVEYAWFSALGGASGSIADKIIYDLTPMMKKYAPNLSKYLKENPDIDKLVKTDDGQYYAFPNLRGGDKLTLTAGPVLRQDWLNDLGLKAPETLDEWENVLKKFRDEKKAAAPLSINKVNKSLLFSMVNAAYDFYVDGDTMKFGPAQPEFKEALITLNRWFTEGLLDNNYAMTDTNLLDANMLNGKSGATIASGGGDMGKWLSTKQDTPSYSLTGVKYPEKAAGEKNRFIPVGHKYATWNCAAVTTACKYPELACKYLDFGYTDEGHMLNNFGVEGVSYTMQNGEPVYTDEIMKNPEGLTMGQAMGKYMRSSYGGPFVQDERYLEQYYTRTEQKDALTAWHSNTEEAKKTVYPAMSHTTDENAELSTIVSELQKCRDENTAAFISGIRPISEYDDFVKELEKLNLARALEIENGALKRFNNK